MIRSFLIATALTFCVAGPALAENTSGPTEAPSETPEQRAERCDMQTVIVENAIAQRLKNRSQKRATKKVLKSDPIKGTKYEANVDVLVAWIFTIPERQLNDDTVATFKQACLNYEG